jgi:hypothetical protein
MTARPFTDPVVAGVTGVAPDPSVGQGVELR